MTKIFEALEIADINQLELRETNPESEATPKVRDYVPAKVVTEGDLAVARHEEIETIASRLYQNIETLLPGPAGKIIQFQASREGEGTTTVVRKLAEVAALQMNKTVLLLDMNPRKLNQARCHNLDPKWSWEEDWKEQKTFKERCDRYDGSPLYMIKIPFNETKNLFGDSPRLALLLEKIKTEFDLILVDSPAASSGGEGQMLASWVDGIVLVVEAGKTRWQVVDRVKRDIEARNGKILGVVLNKRRYPIPNFIYNRI